MGGYNLENILSNLKSGKAVTPKEKKFINDNLDFFEEEELEEAIRIFGLLNTSSSDNLQRIEKYLDTESDIVLSGVVKVLCANSYWGLVANYIERLKTFLNKDDAFELSETQIAVFSVMGEYLNNTSDVRLFEFLYNLFIKEIEEYRDNKDFFQKARLERMYHCLDVGIRGREAVLEYRVGQMEIPEGINAELMMDVVKLIKKGNSTN